MNKIPATNQTVKRYRLRMRPLYRIHQRRNERRNCYAGYRLQNFTVCQSFSAPSCTTLPSKLLRTECLHTFSTFDPAAFSDEDTRHLLCSTR